MSIDNLESCVINIDSKDVNDLYNDADHVYHCWNDTESFTGNRYGFPIERLGYRSWVVRGIFCSLGCVKRFIMDNSSLHASSLLLFYKMAFEIYQVKDIHTPPSRFCLNKFTPGGITIYNYRQLYYRQCEIRQHGNIIFQNDTENVVMTLLSDSKIKTEHKNNSELESRQNVHSSIQGGDISTRQLCDKRVKTTEHTYMDIDQEESTARDKNHEKLDDIHYRHVLQQHLSKSNSQRFNSFAKTLELEMSTSN